MWELSPTSSDHRMLPPEIVRHESGVIAIHKPAGLATQAPPGIPSVESWLRDHLHGGDASAYVGIPHRLDRAVTGVVLMATTPRAARKLSRQFERREVTKTYLAVVSRPVDHQAESGGTGGVGLEAREWRDFLEKLPDEARSRVADAATPSAREAVTLARRLTSAGDPPAGWLVLEFQPLTGRMHQLRLQSASRGLPIVGDDLYGGLPLAAGDVRERPILLHAWRIAYADPDTAERIEVVAPLPSHWPHWARPA